MGEDVLSGRVQESVALTGQSEWLILTRRGDLYNRYADVSRVHGSSELGRTHQEGHKFIVIIRDATVRSGLVLRRFFEDRTTGRLLGRTRTGP